MSFSQHQEWNHPLVWENLQPLVTGPDVSINLSNFFIVPSLSSLSLPLSQSLFLIPRAVILNFVNAEIRSWDPLLKLISRSHIWHSDLIGLVWGSRCQKKNLGDSTVSPELETSTLVPYSLPQLTWRLKQKFSPNYHPREKQRPDFIAGFLLGEMKDWGCWEETRRWGKGY